MFLQFIDVLILLPTLSISICVMSRVTGDCWLQNWYKTFATAYSCTDTHDETVLPSFKVYSSNINPLNAELNPICHLLVLLGDLTRMGPRIVSIFQYITNKMQRYTVYLYLETALHVSGGTSTHHYEHTNCIYSIWYLSHRYCYPPLSWKSLNRFECAVGGVRHPQHTQTGRRIFRARKFSAHLLSERK
jgi:hypothetical protein